MAIDFDAAVSRAKQHMTALSDEAREELQRLTDEDHSRQHSAFLEKYEVGECYLCGKSFKTVSKDDPCLHWLLRQGKFKPKDIKLVAAKFGYFQIASYVRWCANAEKLLANINDISDEAPAGKVISCTVRWKNIEWSFDCSPNDFGGHGGAHSNFPHYHFQMRIDGRQFINFNDYHLPFNDYDLFALHARADQDFQVGFGVYGAGMSDAMDIDPQLIVDETLVSDSEDDATYGMSTMIMANGGTISGCDILKMIQESERTGRSVASISREFYKDDKTVSIQTMISPSSSVPEITPRTERERR